MPNEPALCPNCGQQINAVMPLAPADAQAVQAKAGDVMFCSNCSAMLIFDDVMLPVIVSDVQRAKLLSEKPELRQAEERAHNAAALARQLSASSP